MPTMSRREHMRRSAYRSFGRRHPYMVIMADLWWLWLALIGVTIAVLSLRWLWVHVNAASLAWYTGIGAVAVGAIWTAIELRSRAHARPRRTRLMTNALAAASVLALAAASISSVVAR
jgi:hypothetical protein